MGIGKRIKESRELLGYTQKELGALVGVTASAITNYENETSHPKEAIMYKLISALRVDANYLFQDEMRRLQKKEPATNKGDGLSPESLVFAEKVSRLSPEGVQKLLDYMEFLESKDR